MTPLTFVELFAGVGGLSMGLETAGWRCVGHAEWEAFPRRVLKHRWPEVPLWGDVSKLNGHDIVKEVGPFTMLTFGAPCQDFSIAGARAGMGGERSVLVLDALRIWEESGAPFALYENVVGMLSSNQGADFAGILSVFVGDSVAVPARGWKGGGGIVRGRRGVAAWRVLDAQYFGVPQRRRRVFVLGVRDGSVDPAQVLSLLEGVSGHPPARRAKRQGAPADTGAGVAGSRTGFSTTSSVGYVHDVMPSLPHLTGLNCPGAQMLGVLAFDNRPQVNSSGIHDTITTEGARNPASVLTYDARGNGDGQTVNTMAGDHQNRVTDYTAIVLRNREGKPGGGKGPLLSPERSLTLGTANDQVLFTHADAFRMVAFGEYATDGTASAIKARDYKDATDLAVGQVGIPRRLTPVECERLMGWPDGWTDVPDEKGKPAPDTARYKACGNGVASPVAAWIGFRLREALEAGDA